MILSVFASSVTLSFAAIFHIVGHVLKIDLLMVGGADFEVFLVCFHHRMLTAHPQERMRNYCMQPARCCDICLSLFLARRRKF